MIAAAASRRWKPNWASWAAKPPPASTTRPASPRSTTSWPKEKEALAGLEKHWNEEKELVAKILDLRAKLRAGGVGPTTPESAQASRRQAADRNLATPAATPPTGNGQLTPEERDKLLAELKAAPGEAQAVPGRVAR